ncbi:nitroreductase family deazaflavin-dependent oxidoreductase [Gordonia sp. (in: high G+C Gram-positive bacteria)]|jgi:deazaflavin-dependent oxidoreductase (nitroreductase family)|uniref:nitroreductase family deazaflavin-dependent oxidoreductase n=1 Tax=Gordonia sp. (in: high G+C Gram-positive bacteria) TaxID=84139 RepID=UPI001DC84EE3|nr:nitroreductase family deazaflavin-dependent oxidoreductase [Gordonia sp. (in: high G+C Gram-positive bacteria)]MCB1295555.1 nitroreductase family deazaflavin-dependent oxidoreductase [Gordonia sp. (in: high G+C Gram-positive bacteria)]HMS76442.1 nitroreductase family deazaflavin-dependent oxidoreductase [Gordonia sp. (in: high G+C Gram-positive bacteria)]HQV19046.1 nitroreductase family deazaflavin-dependent oxidoreductase [Gordonia sp. (in: high G+C Gram-positive bacteria)]
MGSDKHPNDTPETPMLIPGKVEDFVNKYIAPTWNGVAKKMPVFSVVKHTGRTSGKAYETPVSSFRKGDVLAIGLMHGKTNWAKNVLAAGEADVKLPKGKVVHITNPRIVAVGSNAPELPKPARAMLKRSAVFAADIV